MEFLFENPILIFLLIGLISSFFKKGSGEEKKDQRPSSRPARTERPEPRRAFEHEKSQQPLGPATRAQTTDGKPVKDLQMDSSVDQQVENPMSEMQKKYEEWKQERAQVPHDKVERKTRAHNQKEDTVKKKPAIQIKPDPEQVIEGMVWAQIMSPPKAKNPHRVMRR